MTSAAPGDGTLSSSPSTSTRVQLTWSRPRRRHRVGCGSATSTSTSTAPADDRSIDRGPGSIAVDGLPPGTLRRRARRARAGRRSRPPRRCAPSSPPPGRRAVPVRHHQRPAPRRAAASASSAPSSERPRPPEPYPVRAAPRPRSTSSRRGAPSCSWSRATSPIDARAEPTGTRFGRLVGRRRHPGAGHPRQPRHLATRLADGPRRSRRAARRPAEPPGRVRPVRGLARPASPTRPRSQVRDVPGLRIVAVDTTVPDSRPRQHRATCADEVADAVRAEPGTRRGRRPAPPAHDHARCPPTCPSASTRPRPALPRRARCARQPGQLGHLRPHPPPPPPPPTARWCITEVGLAQGLPRAPGPATWSTTAGIRQVVRRVAAPTCSAWTDRSRGRRPRGRGVDWSPGSPRRDRCFTHPWPAR